MNIHITNKKGFTLIETLVAITILMVAIAGPLTIATKAYTASLDARNQTIATNLAQETMEYLNNIKDREGGFTKLYPIPDPDPISCSSDSKRCYVNNNLVVSTCTTCDVYYKNDSSGYNYDAGDASPFSRYYYITTLADIQQVLATVVVSWNTGSVENSITLQNVLVNQPR